MQKNSTALSPHSSFISRSLWIISALSCLFLASYWLLQASGFFPIPHWLAVVQLALVAILFNSSKKIFWGIFFPLATIQALYAPVGIKFGSPSYQYVVSIFATDLMETKEFLRQLPLTGIAMSLGIILSLVIFRIISQKQKLYWHKNKTLLFVTALCLIWQQPPLQFYHQGIQSLVKVKNELDRLNNFQLESHWGESTLNANSTYDDYVLILGESARKDYHHAYGYPVENTPFMSSAKGVLVDGFTSGGTNTIASLKLMLTKPNKQQWEGNYNLNLVDLIKSAGIKTYWLSNQGYLGEFDTPVSALANRSDERIFLKSGDSINSSNISDFALLPKFQTLLEQPHQGKRFIVVHLYGSHPISCDRIADYPKIFDDKQIDNKYFNVNCYISSIKKTDDLLKQTYEILQKNAEKQHRTFSMIYFSDHGLSHHFTEKSIDIHNNNGKSKHHFDIPLFKISSDDTERKKLRSFKSGLNFVEGIAHWIGISNNQIDPEMDLFNGKDDTDDYGLKKQIEKIEMPDDPAVGIPF